MVREGLAAVSHAGQVSQWNVISAGSVPIGRCCGGLWWGLGGRAAEAGAPLVRGSHCHRCTSVTGLPNGYVS